jgi:hypothetical protein
MASVSTAWYVCWGVGVDYAFFVYGLVLGLVPLV